MPAIVIGRIHGAALGGGSGLAAVCDIVVAADDAIFGFTETKLGILPAMISPYVLQKIGASAARELFLTGLRFDATKAQGDRARSRGGRRRRSRRGGRSVCGRSVERIADRRGAREGADSERARQAARRRDRHHRRRDRRAARVPGRPGRLEGVPRKTNAVVDDQPYLRHVPTPTSDPPAADRQSRRDRPPHHPRMPRARHRDGRGLFRRRCRRAACLRRPIARFASAPPPARDSYLNIDAIIAAAQSTQADAVHPGYGFLSERAPFARACENAGLIFVGPPASALEKMGSKIGARALMTGAGVPVVPGETPADQSDDALTAAAASGSAFPC